jgi:hypothetical protein
MTERRGPYSLIVRFAQGHEQVIFTSHNPVAARAAEGNVSRNPRTVAQIELHDLTGRLETIWSRNWSEPHTIIKDENQ